MNNIQINKLVKIKNQLKFTAEASNQSNVKNPLLLCILDLEKLIGELND